MIHLHPTRRFHRFDLTVHFVRERGRRQEKKYLVQEQRLELRWQKRKREDDWFRRQGAEIFALARRNEARTVLLDDSRTGGSMSRQQIVEVVEGFLLADNSRNLTYGKAPDPIEIEVSVPALQHQREELQRIEALLGAVQMARDLVLEAPNRQAPENLAIQIEEKVLALGQPEEGAEISFEVHKVDALTEQGLRLLLAVGAAGEPPVLIHGRWRPAPPQPVKMPRITLVGKGITFDAGGLDLKPPAGMLHMKYDMSGAAAAAALLGYVAARNLPVEVDLIVPAAENLVAGNAMRPGDIYKSYQGDTVEITNTDAEGRLVLADALAWAQQHATADLTVDLATLTGAATMTTGWNIVAMGTAERVLTALHKVGLACGEKIVELPLWDEYAEELKSEVADLKNASNTRNAGTISAAKFLERFAPENWVHLDIAAAAWNTRRRGCLPAGPTGAGIRLVAGLLEQIAANPARILTRRKKV